MIVCYRVLYPLSYFSRSYIKDFLKPVFFPSELWFGVFFRFILSSEAFAPSRATVIFLESVSGEYVASQACTRCAGLWRLTGGGHGSPNPFFSNHPSEEKKNSKLEIISVTVWSGHSQVASD